MADEERRRPSRRRVPDALKMGCPFCAESASAVLRSRGSITIDKIHRRRECAGCGRRFPTNERVDYQLLARELNGGDDPELTLADGPPPTFDTLRDALVGLWDDAAAGIYNKRKWQRAQLVLGTLANRPSHAHS